MNSCELFLYFNVITCNLLNPHPTSPSPPTSLVAASCPHISPHCRPHFTTSPNSCFAKVYSNTFTSILKLKTCFAKNYRISLSCIVKKSSLILYLYFTISLQSNSSKKIINVSWTTLQYHINSTPHVYKTHFFQTFNFVAVSP